MIKKTIKFIDYEGNERTVEKYFNLSKSEILEWQSSIRAGYLTILESKVGKGIVNPNPKDIMDVYKEFIKRSYGVKSEDGMVFMKNEDIWNEFYHSEAYTALLMELLTEKDKANEFFEGIYPNDIRKEIKEAIAKMNTENEVPTADINESKN